MLTFWIVMVLLIGALQYAMPQLTRRDIFFSVTVEPEFRMTPQAREILARYRGGIVIVTAIILMLTVAAARDGMELGVAALPMLELALSVGCFVIAHRHTLAHASAASSTREASLAPQPRLAGLGALLLGPYVMIACAALITRAHWDAVPDPMPVHWDVAGNPNGWMPKTWMLFAALIGSELVLCAILTFSIIAMVYFSRQIAASGAKAREERRFRWIGIAALVAGSYLSAALAFLPLNAHGTFAFGGVTFFIAIMIVGSLELVRRGEGGVRLAHSNGDAVVSDRTPDACWKWGMLYYNPNDPALMVEKRFGIGWTLNFAHRAAWVFMALLLAAVMLALSMPMLARLR